MSLQSLGTGFPWRKFLLLGSQTVPVALTHYALLLCPVTDSSELSPRTVSTRALWTTHFLVLSLVTSKWLLAKVILWPIVSWPFCLGVRHQSGTRDQFFSSLLELFVDSCGFVDVGCPLWQEAGSVVFSCCWASPAQPFSGPIPIWDPHTNFSFSLKFSLDSCGFVIL
jgi:hypothetical protein